MPITTLAELREKVLAMSELPGDTDVLLVAEGCAPGLKDIRVEEHEGKPYVLITDGSDN